VGYKSLYRRDVYWNMSTEGSDGQRKYNISDGAAIEHKCTLRRLRTDEDDWGEGVFREIMQDKSETEGWEWPKIQSKISISLAANESLPMMTVEQKSFLFIVTFLAIGIERKV
jgi:hypothetical protein